MIGSWAPKTERVRGIARGWCVLVGYGCPRGHAVVVPVALIRLRIQKDHVAERSGCGEHRPLEEGRFADRVVMVESLILAQDQRWRRA